MDAQPLYRRLAGHYRQAILAGTLHPGDRMPSVRALIRQHRVSLSTALQACRSLEDEGLLEARPRSGYFVRLPRRAVLRPASEPDPRRIDPAQYVGMHARVSDYVAQCQRHPVLADLSAAFAAPALYPGVALNRAAARALRHAPELLVSMPPAHGEPRLRAVLARRALDAGIQVSVDDIVVTHGCTEALNIALRAVSQPGDVIAVESPTYYGLLQVLESLGLRALEIPTSPQRGLSVDALELAFRTQDAVKAVVAMPNLHNPLGTAMADADKARLVALCAQHGVPLIEDDSYGALTDDAPSRAAKAWDVHGQVIYCASLRKTLAPGLRLGWITGGRWQPRIAMLKHAQSRSNEALSQRAAAELMEGSGYDRHLTRLRQGLKAQRERTAEAIAAWFPAGTRLSVPGGSMLLWVGLPQACSGRTVFEAALPQGIRVVPGDLFSNADRYDAFLRISCGLAWTPETDRALRRLADIVARVADTGADTTGAVK